MPAVEFFYFPVRGRGELSRLILAAGAPSSDYVIHDLQDFQFKSNPNCLFGQAPFANIDGRPVAQSHAIERTLATKYQLYGKSSDDRAIIDMVLETVDEAHTEISKLLYKSPSGSAKDVFNAGLARLKKLAKVYESDDTAAAGKEGSAYLLKSGLSVADLAVFDLVDILRMYADYLKKKNPIAEYPRLVAAASAVAAVPGVAAYVASPARSEVISPFDPWVSTGTLKKKFPGLGKHLAALQMVRTADSIIGGRARCFTFGFLGGAGMALATLVALGTYWHRQDVQRILMANS
eukprot:TRINITY_DN26661_c0_g1_i1.p1 TRINITY_DN26661_c0_g1~~TRINITY_DN26661_c0_g1_i1.p1  ORF type:complete len:292 (+),score=55.64 TRINITY_DN26661_c0_g1_i1:54-929(+)